MRQKFYLDTAIWRDYYEDRSDNSKQLGKLALRFLIKIIKENSLILFSDLIVRELMAKYSKEEIIDILAIFHNLNLLVKVPISQEQANEAADLHKEKGIPFGDALHAILSRDNKAVMVTRDKHFKRLINIAGFKKPEDLL